MMSLSLSSLANAKANRHPGKKNSRVDSTHSKEKMESASSSATPPPPPNAIPPTTPPQPPITAAPTTPLRPIVIASPSILIVESPLTLWSATSVEVEFKGPLTSVQLDNKELVTEFTKRTDDDNPAASPKPQSGLDLSGSSSLQLHSRELAAKATKRTDDDNPAASPKPQSVLDLSGSSSLQLDNLELAAKATPSTDEHNPVSSSTLQSVLELSRLLSLQLDSKELLAELTQRAENYKPASPLTPESVLELSESSSESSSSSDSLSSSESSSYEVDESSECMDVAAEWWMKNFDSIYSISPSQSPPIPSMYFGFHSFTQTEKNVTEDCEFTNDGCVLLCRNDAPTVSLGTDPKEVWIDSPPLNPILRYNKCASTDGEDAYTDGKVFLYPNEGKTTQSKGTDPMET